jgi:GNAT superfamily N-acetyltransferase
VLIQDVEFQVSERALGSTVSGQAGEVPRPPIELVEVRAGDWRLLREARLMALRSSPEAFCGDYGRESRASRRTWRRRARSGSWLVARLDGRIMGLAGMFDEPDPVGGPDARWGTRCVESVWVHPDLRRQGVVRQVLQAVETQALGQGVGTLVLWVLESNPVAAEVYRRLGYTPTGRSQPISIRGRWDVEERLMKSLA